MEGNLKVNYEDEVLKVYLAGSLDATNAQGLSDQIKTFKEKTVTKIIFFAKELDYIASAGLRVIIFSIQRILDPGGEAYFIGGQKDVLSVISMTGLDDSLIIQDTYPG